MSITKRQLDLLAIEKQKRDVEALEGAQRNALSAKEAKELEIEIRKRQPHKTQFSKIVAGDLIIINKEILFDLLEKRIYETKLKIEDLFLLCKAPNGMEGEQLVDTPFGKLRVFFVNKELRSSHLLHKSKYDYPKISKISTKGSHKTTKEMVDEAVEKFNPSKVDITSQANEALKTNYRVN